MQAAIREALIGLVAADALAELNTVPIAYDNAPFAWDNPPAHFVEYNVRFYHGHQIGLGQPRTRVKGFVYVTANIKEGKGSKLPLVALDWFSQKLGYASIVAPGVNIVLEAPDFLGNHPSARGWYVESLKVPFRADPT